MTQAVTDPSVFVDKTSFDQTAAFQKLKALANHPADLTNESFFTPERIQKYVSSGAGWKLLYAMERVDDEVITALQQLSQECHLIEKMEAMQSGVMANFLVGNESEERLVLHTAVRDFFDDPNDAPAAGQATALAKAEFHKLEHFIERIDREGRFTDLISIGIGGSELGPKMLYFGLEGHQKNRRVHFISNVDPDDAAQVLKELDLHRTLVFAVSKSGGTLETKTNEDLVRNAYKEAGLDPKEYFLACTGKGSPMDDPEHYRESFYIWDWIGGRYCGTSLVGGVILAFAYGMDAYRELLRGAHAMDRTALNNDLRRNPPLLHALLGIWNRNFLAYPTVAVIPYSRMLWRFAAHIQQLDMESNGKRVSRRGETLPYGSGPIIWGEPATNAQHSFFQLIHQGTDIIPLEFIGFAESECDIDLEVQGTTSQQKLLANLFAQSLSLAMGQAHANPNKVFPGNRPSLLLLNKQLTPYSLGALLAHYEHKVAFQGFVWGNNSFDQEGVQLGKVLANRVLQRIQSRQHHRETESFPLGDALLDQLDTLT